MAKELYFCKLMKDFFSLKINHVALSTHMPNLDRAAMEPKEGLPEEDTGSSLWTNNIKEFFANLLKLPPAGLVCVSAHKQKVNIVHSV